MNSEKLIQALREKIVEGGSQFSVVCSEDNLETTCTLVWNDRLPIILEAMENSPQLAMSCGLGMPSVNRRAQVLELLLHFNSLYRRLRGTRIGIYGDEGEPFLVCEVDARDVDVHELNIRLESFVSTALWWRAAVVDGARIKSTEGPVSMAFA